MTTAPHSRLLQFLFDAEKPLRIADGDNRRLQAQVLCDLGLVDYRKSGWWQTSEAGHRFVGGSIDVNTFLYQLRELAQRTLEANAPGLGGKLNAAESKQRRNRYHSAQLALEWLRDGRA